MNAIKPIKTFGAAIAMGALACALPASAGTLVLGGGGSEGSIGNTRVFTDGDVTMRASAWSIDQSGVIHSAALGRWSMGIGVRNGASDNSHTTDNKGWIDLILLQFSSAVILGDASFKTGWHSMNDTDASIGHGNIAGPYTSLPAWNNAALASALSGLGFYESTSAGQGNSTRNINLLGHVASTWIIAASRINADGKADGFKLNSLTYSSPPAVPEPATWAMMLVGLGLVAGMMRQSRRHGVRTAHA